jgi:hypothetical protein
MQPPAPSSGTLRFSGILRSRQTAAIKPAGDTQKTKNKHTHMNTRAIPKNQPALIAFSARALAGVQSLGITLSIAQNTAPRIATDHHDLVGEPGAAGDPGKQAELNTKRHAVTVAQTARHEALDAGRKFCSDAVDLLKPHLGRTWNSLWQVAGFSRFSIATSSARPYPVLLELRNYFRANPARENVTEGITADLADAKATAIQAAEQALDAAKSARTNAAAARDAAVRQLHRRLTGLREELDLILSDTDHRWYDFGFSRPIDSRLPDPVIDLIATPGLPGPHAGAICAIRPRAELPREVAGGRQQR